MRLLGRGDDVRRAEVHGLTDVIAVAAREAGHTLGTIHVEELATDPQAFDALLADVKELNVRAVVIPTKVHLGRWDLTGSESEQLRRATSAEIIVAGTVPLN